MPSEQQIAAWFEDTPLEVVSVKEVTKSKIPSDAQLRTAFLRQRQSLPLNLVVEMSLRRIRLWREYWQTRGRDVCVSLGGKDSHALLHLVRTVYPDVPGVFVDTGLEYPEVRELNMRTPNVITVKPDVSFSEVIRKHGWPVISKKAAQYIREAKVKTGKNEATRRLRLTGYRSNGTYSPMAKIPNKWQYLLNAPFKISDRCCKEIKIKPIDKVATKLRLTPMIGTTASESAQRERNWLQFGCNAFGAGKPVSTPIIFWTEQHVLQYLRENTIEVASCYGEQVEHGGRYRYTGTQRTGCAWCAFGSHLEERPNRFERLEQTHPQLWHYCMYKLGLKEVLQYCGIPWGREQGELF